MHYGVTKDAKKKGTTGIEPVTIGSAIQCSTAELCTLDGESFTSDIRFDAAAPPNIYLCPLK